MRSDTVIKIRELSIGTLIKCKKTNSLCIVIGEMQDSKARRLLWLDPDEYGMRCSIQKPLDFVLKNQEIICVLDKTWCASLRREILSEVAKDE